MYRPTVNYKNRKYNTEQTMLSDWCGASDRRALEFAFIVVQTQVRNGIDPIIILNDFLGSFKKYTPTSTGAPTFKNADDEVSFYQNKLNKSCFKQNPHMGYNTIL